MLGEKDLIFLGACFILAGEASKTGMHYLNSTDISTAVNRAQELFYKVFDNLTDKDEKMILE